MRLRASEKPVPTKKLITVPSAFKDSYAALVTALKRGAVATLDAGIQVAWLLDNDPKAMDTFRTLGLSVFTVKRLERIGRGRLLPELAVRTTLCDKLPITDQRRIANDTVPALVETAGKFKVTQVKLLESSMIIQNRVVGHGKLRSIDEQTEYMRGFEHTPHTTPWHITKAGRVAFSANSSYTQEELAVIVKALAAWHAAH
jgi:hypothetical protein